MHHSLKNPKKKENMIMKSKYFIILLAVILTSGFTGCVQNGNKIDECTWNLATIQSTENVGAIIAYDPNVARSGDSYGDASVIEIFLTTGNGKLVLQDKTNVKTYEGTYSVTDSNPNSTIYKITVDGKEGTAVLSDTEYADGTSVATLILSFDDYTLNFTLSD